MKYSLSSRFARLTLAMFFGVLASSVTGVAAAAAGPEFPCGAWPFCAPSDPRAWMNLVHELLAGVAGLLVIWTLVYAWQRLRQEPVLLPLSTVSATLFFGQAFVGAIQVVRGFPQHLVVLHALTAVSLWVALVALLATSGFLPDRRESTPAPQGPRQARDFLTLGKPLIVALLLLTTLGGLVAGGRAWPAFPLAFWTMLGGALAAAGASALNQYIDRELDRKMQRTERRPLAAGRLTPAEGLSYGLALCLVSYYILAGFVNFTAALLSLAGVLYYVVLYSLMLKKSTVQNIVIGGGAGAIPPMVGWAAATGHLSLAAWILFLIIFMWTPPHFWALAIVRAKDYERAGIPMLPVVKGEKAARNQIMIYTVLLVAATLLLPMIRATGIVYLVSALLLGGLLLLAAWRVWKTPGHKVAWTMYRWSSMYLMLMFVALMIDAVV